MATKIKTVLSTALKTLKANTFGFWEPCSYGSCFEPNGELKLESIKTVAPELSQCSSQQALNELRDVLSDYETRSFFEKLWFRWTHPIDVYYQLDEIAVLHELDNAISEDGTILDQAVVNIYEKSRLPKKLGGINRFIEEDWRMLIHGYVGSDDIHTQKNMAGVYNDFKSKCIRYISLATSDTVTSSMNPTRLKELKTGISQIKKASELELKSYIHFSDLSNTIIEQKDIYCQSMTRWEVFTHECCDTLSQVPLEKLHQELETKASTAVVKAKWGDDILQQVNVAKQKLTDFINDMSKSISNKLKAWANFQEDTKQQLADSCALYPSEKLNQDEIKNTVLGLCYQAHIHEQQLRAEFENNLNSLKEMQQQEVKAATYDRQEQENTQKMVVFDTTPDIVIFIKAANESLSPDEIPAWIENLVKQLEESTEPAKQVDIFSDILLWQNRYLEAASWGCTSQRHRISELANQHLECAKKLFNQLALQLHPDQVPNIDKQHIERLIDRRNEHNDYISDLLKTCFELARKQTPWMNHVWVAGGFSTTQGRIDESDKQAIKALRKQMKLEVQATRSGIAKNEEGIKEIRKGIAEKEKTDDEASRKFDEVVKKSAENAKISDEITRTFKQVQEGIKNLGNQMKGIQNNGITTDSIKQSTASIRAANYMNNKLSDNYTPGLHKAETRSAQLNHTSLDQLPEDSAEKLMRTV